MNKYFVQGDTMEVRLAKSAGFCFGVKRAVDTVYEQIQTGQKIYTYGPIIHNEQVVQELEEQGVTVLHSEAELEALQEGTVIIRSHGVSKDIYEKMERQGLRCVDATCPFVKRIHDVVHEKSLEGCQILIVGDLGHPEVEGIRGWCEGNCTVVRTEAEIRNLQYEKDARICMVAQTTFNYKKFQELVEIFCEKGYDVSVVDTICNATEARQTEARCLAAEVDAMIVIGGANSSNTRKLYEICSRECKNTFFIQSRDDLNFGIPDAAETVGITAGASTPNNIIEEVQNYVRLNF